MGKELYPGSGEVALLCEGDLAGYEAAIMRRWTRGIPLVDIWPCGTCNAVIGFSDAIGRTRPICAIVDRDFRSQEEAQKTCRDHKKTREDRGISVLSWRSWRRNEIENYFLDDAILLPVFSSVFGCKPDDVTQALQEVLTALLPFQALERAVYRAGLRWTEPHPTSVLCHFLPPADQSPPACRRPTWSDKTSFLVAPDITAIEVALKRNAEILPKDRLPGMESLAEDFRGFVNEWSAGKPIPWRNDWCGKEILSWIRVLLSSRFGSMSREGKKSYQWDGKNRKDWSAQDRALEKSMQADIQVAFLDSITNKSASAEVQTEFDEILSTLRSPDKG